MEPRYRRRLAWPWLSIIYFVTSLILIAIAATIAVSLGVEMNDLKKRVKNNEDFIDGIPGLLEQLRMDLCAKVDALRDDLEDRLDDIDAILGDGPFQPLDEKAQPDGYAPLDGDAIVPDEHLPPELMFLGNEGGGCWNPTTNTPTLQGGKTCNVGEFYVANNTGTTVLDGFGGGGDPWQVGDGLVCTGDVGWKRVRDVPRVKTWNGLTGDVMALLDSLLDVDTTGAANSDVLHFNGGVWGPLSDCCLPLVKTVGFFAIQEVNFDLIGPNSWLTFDKWTLPGPYFNDAVLTQTAVPADGFGFSLITQVYKVPRGGWWTLHVRMHFRLEDDPRAIGVRIQLFTSFVNLTLAIDGHRRAKGQLGFSNIIDINGIFPLCRGENLIVQILDDEPDTTLRALKVIPFIAGSTQWSGWRMPDQLMPPFTCGGFPLDTLDGRLSYLHRLGIKTHVAKDGQISALDSMQLEKMAYLSRLSEWKERRVRKEWCSNCTSMEVGPKPEPPA